MRYWAVLVLALLACACGSRKRLTCDRPIKGLDLQQGAILWFGEMHGTTESPKFAGDVACNAARLAHVQLGLEIWQTEQQRIDRYLLDGDRKALLEGPFWAQHDGRSSVAMVALLDQVRTIRKGGGRVEVVAYDVTNEPDRDKAMAKAVLAARNQGAVFVGLSGNIHSRRTKWNELTPLVAHLLAEKLPVRTHDVSASGGTIWACIATDDHEPKCGEHPNSNDGGKGVPGTIGPPRDDSHDGVYFVGPTTASPPVKP